MTLDQFGSSALTNVLIISPLVLVWRATHEPCHEGRVAADGFCHVGAELDTTDLIAGMRRAR